MQGVALHGADLEGAWLDGANLPEPYLDGRANFKSATLRNGQKYEDWVKSRGEVG
jgi:uncharacterized protein YjbI with pentapeptide repeats